MYFMHFMNVHINDSTKVYTITWTFLLIIIMIHLWDGGDTSDAYAHMKISNIMFGHNLQTWYNNYKSCGDC